MKRKHAGRALVVAVAIGLGLAVNAAYAETLLLTVEECVSIAPAIVDHVKGNKHPIAISQDAQKVVEYAAPKLKVAMAAAVANGEITPEQAVEFLETEYASAMAFQCLQASMMYGDEIPVEIE